MEKKSGPLRVIELFAGVGGFRIGLERASKGSRTPGYKVVWSNQWEPGAKTQHASDIYVKRFGAEHHSNQDISKVAIKDIPDHDLLVGGFPCQDYSVARTLNQAAGIVGKKGVLWWEIYRILDKKRPNYVFLENVDRLLKSPASQRGRDFAIMLGSIADLGYAVEWRVINAAEYGFPQRRRRVFILAYQKRTAIYGAIRELTSHIDWMEKSGVLAQAFPVIEGTGERTYENKIEGGLADITSTFNDKHPDTSPFKNTGLMIGRTFWTVHTKAKYTGKSKVLKDLVLDESKVPESFFIRPEDVKKWKYLKGAKTIPRKHKKNGHEYKYSEGAMAFPDPLDAPARTIITGEGGSSPSRFKHVIRTRSGKMRRLTPLELERINMFPDDHTESIPDIKRAFLMGNALVIGIIERAGKVLYQRIMNNGK